MLLILEIRVLAGMPVNHFEIPVLAHTLEITKHPSGYGSQIKILDHSGSERLWFAVDIYTVKFEVRAMQPPVESADILLYPPKRWDGDTEH